MPLPDGPCEAHGFEGCALCHLSGGPGEELVAERLTPAAQVPYEAGCTMGPWEKPSQPREEGTGIDGCRSLPGDRRSLADMARLPLSILVWFCLSESCPSMQSTPELGSDGVHAVAPWVMT